MWITLKSVHPTPTTLPHTHTYQPTQQYDNCFPHPEWIDDCFACNGDPSFDSIGKVNGSCTDETPPSNYYSWNNTSPLCAYEFPVDGIDYTTKYTALKFQIMERELLAQNRTILYSLCEWGELCSRRVVFVLT